SLVCDGGVDALDVGIPAAGVLHPEALATPVGDVGDAVAGDAGEILHDGLAAPDEPVDQRGLAHVGAAHDGDGAQGLLEVFPAFDAQGAFDLLPFLVGVVLTEVGGGEIVLVEVVVVVIIDSDIGVIGLLIAEFGGVEVLGGPATVGGELLLVGEGALDIHFTLGGVVDEDGVVLFARHVLLVGHWLLLSAEASVNWIRWVKTSSMVIAEVSMMWASSAGFSGDAARVESSSSRLTTAASTSSKSAARPAAVSWLYRRCARTSGEAVR